MIGLLVIIVFPVVPTICFVIIIVLPVALTKINTLPQALLGFVDLQGMLDKRVRIANFLFLLQRIES